MKLAGVKIILQEMDRKFDVLRKDNQEMEQRLNQKFEMLAKVRSDFLNSS